MLNSSSIRQKQKHALEKKIDDGIRKLDVSIKAMKEESDAKLDAKIEELKQLMLGTAPSQSTHVDPEPQITKVAAKTDVYVPPIRRRYDDLGFELHNAESSTTIGKYLRPKSWDECNLCGREFGVDPQAAVDREMQHVMGTNQTRERVHRGAGTNQAGDRFAYHGFEHRMRKLKMPVFEGEDAYGWIYRVERYFEIQGLPQHEQLRAVALCMEGEALSWYRWSEGRTPFHSWDGFKRCLLIRFQQSQEGNLYELAITQEESARAYVALFEKLAGQLVGIPESVMEATFIKGLKPVLRAAVRVMNPEGLNNAMELAVSIEDNQLYEGVMQSKGVAAVVGQTTSKGDNFRRMTESEIQDRKAKGLCFRCEEKYTPGHRCASRTLQVMLVDESDEAEPDLNFKS
ncbi:ankyrin repeat-containing protein [Tanacetum coccineum]